MSRSGVLEGQFTLAQQNMLALRGMAEDSMRRVRIGDDWLFCRPQDFDGDTAIQRQRLRQLSRNQPHVRAGWVQAHGRRELAWLIGPDDLVLVPHNVVKHTGFGLLISTVALAAFIGAFWGGLVLLDENGPMQGLPGWLILFFMPVFLIGTVGGVFAMIMGYALLTPGLSASRRRAYRTFRRQGHAAGVQTTPAHAPPESSGRPESRREVDPASGLVVLEGRIRHIASRDFETSHRTLEVPTYAVPIQSQRITITLEGESTPVFLRTPTQDVLFLYPGDDVRVVGLMQNDVVELLGMRNVTDGSGYVATPGKVINRWSMHVFTALIVLVGAGSLGMLAWDGDLDAHATKEILGALGAVLAVYYGLILAGYFLGLRNRSVDAHAQPGEGADIRRTRELLGLPPRGGAVGL